MEIIIKKASDKNLEDLVPLFDAYRVFYEQSSDRILAKKFLEERFEREDTFIFIAYNEEEEAIGFTQLFPVFSSISAKKDLILNDLYVNPNFRGKGIGQKLLETAKQFAISKKYKGLALETAKHNPAQKLYEQLGWSKEEDFFHYYWKA